MSYSCLNLINEIIGEVDADIFLLESQCRIKGFNIDDSLTKRIRKLKKKKYTLIEIQEILKEKVQEA